MAPALSSQQILRSVESPPAAMAAQEEVRLKGGRAGWQWKGKGRSQTQQSSVASMFRCAGQFKARRIEGSA